jgi:hypothetical protein
MLLGKAFLGWYLARLCHHGVDTCIIHDRSITCQRCLLVMPITDAVLDEYKKYIYPRTIEELTLKEKVLKLIEDLPNYSPSSAMYQRVKAVEEALENIR